VLWHKNETVAETKPNVLSGEVAVLVPGFWSLPRIARIYTNQCVSEFVKIRAIRGNEIPDDHFSAQPFFCHRSLDTLPRHYYCNGVVLHKRG